MLANSHNMSKSLKDCFWQSINVHGNNDVRHTDESGATEPLVLKPGA